MDPDHPGYSDEGYDNPAWDKYAQRSNREILRGLCPECGMEECRECGFCHNDQCEMYEIPS